MNESTESAQTSRLARACQFWGVFALLMLVLSGGLILDRIWAPRAGSSDLLEPPREPGIGWFLFEVFLHGTAGVAALVAFVLGIVALVDIRRQPGKVEERGRAVTGLASATLTVLTLVLGYGVILPALARAADKLESANKLKRLGLAIHLYHEDRRCLPSPVLRDPWLGDPAQPYSWRVALLPYLGEDKLFSQYRRDKPWDSPANKALLARMPRVFATPGSVRAADGFTHYQVLVGPGTAFERPDSRVRLTDFPRGTEQTILVVEAAVPVPWTKPEDLPYAPAGPLPKVGGLVGNGFHALFADGDVRWFEAEQQDSALRKLVPLNGP